MENPLFRKKTLDRISSPEALHDYMRVTSPRIWMILTAITVLLAGFLVYASIATIENVLPVRLYLQTEKTAEGEYYSVASCYLPLSEKDRVETGMKVRMGEETGKVSWMGTMAEENQIFLQVEMENRYIQRPDGEYDAELILEAVTPIQFLWN